MYYYWDDEKISEHGETLMVTLLRRIEDLQLMNKNCNLELEQVKKDLDVANSELAKMANRMAEMPRSKDGDWK